MHVLVLTAREVLAGVFGLAVVGKLRTRRDWRAFVMSLNAMRVAPAVVAPPLAVAVVVAEAGTCALLVLPGSPAAGEGFAAVLFGGLTVVVARVIRGDRRVTCACFGRTTVALSMRHVVRNGVLAAMAIVGLAHELTTPAGALADVGVPAAVLATATAGVAVGLISRLDDLVWAVRPPLR